MIIGINPTRFSFNSIARLMKTLRIVTGPDPIAMRFIAGYHNLAVFQRICGNFHYLGKILGSK